MRNITLRSSHRSQAPTNGTKKKYRRKIAWVVSLACALLTVVFLGYTGFLLSTVVIAMVWYWALNPKYEPLLDWQQEVVPLVLSYKIGQQVSWVGSESQALVIDPVLAMLLAKKGEKIKRNFAYNILGVLDGQPFHFFKTTYEQAVERSPLVYFSGWVCMLKLPQNITTTHWLIKKGNDEKPLWIEKEAILPTWQALLTHYCLQVKATLYSSSIVKAIVIKQTDYLLLALNEAITLFDVEKELSKGDYFLAFEKTSQDVEKIIEKIHFTQQFL